VAALAEALRLGRAPSEDACAIEEALASKPLASALVCLTEAGIPAVPARHPVDMARDPAIVAADLLMERQFADGSPYLLPNRYARFSRTEHPPIGDAPGVGEHSREVLAEAGLSAAEIDALIADRVVIDGEPMILQGLVNYR
jgi:crotonobetainyl-CoA:carnitine CoA-transferase CaiB-like acyl-CoA transferase